VGVTIDVGSVVEARPHVEGRVAISSHDYGYEEDMEIGKIPYRKELWLLKIADAFRLSGVRFVMRNIIAGITSSGLGGSATATTAVCILANKLARTGFSGEQLVAMASMIEQDMGVSITGTQEQSNVVFGGVTDYVWFPWGIPGHEGGYGSSIRRTLLPESDYDSLSNRIRIYHSGTKRASTDVNEVFRKRLTETKGFELHSRKLKLAYDYREGIRKRDWDRVCHSIREYAKTRIELCPDYMTAECWDIQGQCENLGAESFPLGAGGGGAILIFSPEPERLNELDEILSPVYRRIRVNLKPNGHSFENVPAGF
jgi:galactokinase/mevalonate kinase-like predicted kinase